MSPQLREAIGEAGYDALPESIKDVYSAREWLWLTDTQKAGLIRLECEPETFVD